MNTYGRALLLFLKLFELAVSGVTDGAADKFLLPELGVVFDVT